MEDINKKIGSELRRIRKDKGLSIKQYIEKLSEDEIILSESMVSQYETGRIKISMERFLKIINCLNVKLYEINL